MIVYLAYTKSDARPQLELIRIYKKLSYQLAYNWLAEIAKRHGQSVWAGTPGGNVAAETFNPKYMQYWWLERHECI